MASSNQFYVIRQQACSRCGGFFYFAALEMLDDLIETSTLGICLPCRIPPDPDTGKQKKCITSAFGFDLALRMSAAAG